MEDREDSLCLVVVALSVCSIGDHGVGIVLDRAWDVDDVTVILPLCDSPTFAFYI